VELFFGFPFTHSCAAPILRAVLVLSATFPVFTTRFPLMYLHIPQTLLRVTCVFKSFTPAMAMDMLLAHDNTNSRTFEKYELEKEMNELCEIAVLKRCQPTNFVLSYFPDDLGKSDCYTFVSKLMQEEVYKLMLSDWKTTLERTHKTRSMKVMNAVLRIQSFLRRLRARRVRLILDMLKAGSRLFCSTPAAPSSAPPDMPFPPLDFGQERRKWQQQSLRAAFIIQRAFRSYLERARARISQRHARTSGLMPDEPTTRRFSYGILVRLAGEIHVTRIENRWFVFFLLCGSREPFSPPLPSLSLQPDLNGDADIPPLDIHENVERARNFYSLRIMDVRNSAFPC
jgi:hypothetical protein